MPRRPAHLFRFALGLTALTAGWAAAPVASPIDHYETIRTSVGWRDNVMLSPFAPIGRAFGRAELEAFVSRSHRDWQFLSLMSGDVLRYFSPPVDTGGEQQWFVHAEARWQHWPAWRLALKTDAFLQDTVVDLSETETTRTVLQARVQGVFVALAPLVKLPAGFTLEPLGQVKRVHYRDLPGDYDETKAGARVRWKAAGAFEVTATWLAHRRRYFEREQYTAGGRPRAGTHLGFWQREGEIRAATKWTRAGNWTAAAVLGRLENRDRASGFFDYNQQHARLELSRQSGWWKILLEGDVKRADYRVQTVGAGTVPPPRLAEAFGTRLRAERTLSLHWLGFAEHTWERSCSNEREFSYRANAVLAGVQRDF